MVSGSKGVEANIATFSLYFSSMVANKKVTHTQTYNFIRPSVEINSEAGSKTSNTRLRLSVFLHMPDILQVPAASPMTFYCPVYICEWERTSCSL